MPRKYEDELRRFVPAKREAAAQTALTQRTGGADAAGRRRALRSLGEAMPGMTEAGIRPQPGPAHQLGRGWAQGGIVHGGEVDGRPIPGSLPSASIRALERATQVRRERQPLAPKAPIEREQQKQPGLRRAGTAAGQGALAWRAQWREAQAEKQRTAQTEAQRVAFERQKELMRLQAQLGTEKMEAGAGLDVKVAQEKGKIDPEPKRLDRQLRANIADKDAEGAAATSAETKRMNDARIQKWADEDKARKDLARIEALDEAGKRRATRMNKRIDRLEAQAKPIFTEMTKIQGDISATIEGYHNQQLQKNAYDERMKDLKVRLSEARKSLYNTKDGLVTWRDKLVLRLEKGLPAITEAPEAATPSADYAGELGAGEAASGEEFQAALKEMQDTGAAVGDQSRFTIEQKRQLIEAAQAYRKKQGKG